MATLANPTLGQSIFGHRVLPANFGQSIFGQNWCFFCHFGPMTFLANPFWANLCCVCCVLLCVVCVCVLWWCPRFSWVCPRFGCSRTSLHNFALFSHLPPQFSFFLLSWISFRGIMCTFGLSGFTRQPENSKRAHSRACRFKHHQNSTKRRPRERRKKENCGGKGKKARNFGLPPFGAGTTLRGGPHPSGRAPPFGAGPTFWGGPHLLGVCLLPHPDRPPPTAMTSCRP